MEGKSCKSGYAGKGRQDKASRARQIGRAREVGRSMEAGMQAGQSRQENAERTK
jgi:hypothetical protein